MTEETKRFMDKIENFTLLENSNKITGNDIKQLRKFFVTIHSDKILKIDFSTDSEKKEALDAIVKLVTQMKNAKKLIQPVEHGIINTNVFENVNNPDDYLNKLDTGIKALENIINEKLGEPYVLQYNSNFNETVQQYDNLQSAENNYQKSDTHKNPSYLYILSQIIEDMIIDKDEKEIYLNMLERLTENIAKSILLDISEKDSINNIDIFYLRDIMSNTHELLEVLDTICLITNKSTDYANELVNKDSTIFDKVKKYNKTFDKSEKETIKNEIIEFSQKYDIYTFIKKLDITTEKKEEYKNIIGQLKKEDLYKIEEIFKSNNDISPQLQMTVLRNILEDAISENKVIQQISNLTKVHENYTKEIFQRFTNIGEDLYYNTFSKKNILKYLEQDIKKHCNLPKKYTKNIKKMFKEDNNIYKISNCMANICKENVNYYTKQENIEEIKNILSPIKTKSNLFGNSLSNARKIIKYNLNQLNNWGKNMTIMLKKVSHGKKYNLKNAPNIKKNKSKGREK